MHRLLTMLLGVMLLLLPGEALAEESEDNPVHIAPDDKLPEVTARSAIVLEAATGQVIYARDAESRRYPASTTKMMTLIIALEHGDVNSWVTVSDKAAGVEGSTLWLEKGDRFPLKDMLYGIMMMSGNDATVAIAEHIAGSEAAFARLMTQKAGKLGAVHTNFVNPHGLPADNHYSTAHDLALIAAYGFQIPLFEEIVSAKEKSFSWIKDPRHLWRNENQMLWLYEGANGVKTGYTDLAGRCLVTGAKRNGVQLIAVVLDAVYMWSDSIALLDYGFSRVKPVEIVKAGQEFGEVAVRGGRRAKVPLAAAEDISLPQVTDAPPFRQVRDVAGELKAPVKKGEALGKLRIFCGDREVANTDLIAVAESGRKSFFWLLYEKLSNLWG